MQLAKRMGELGTESAFEVLARAKALEAKGRSVVNLGIGQPDFPTSPHIVDAARKALADGHHGYTPSNGILPLREAVSAHLGERYGAEVNPEDVVIVPGGKVTMAFAMLMFGEAGAEILYPDPGFPIYRSMIAFSGARPVPYPLPETLGFGIDAADVLARVTSRTRLIILNSPGNPTGGIIAPEEAKKLAAGLLRWPEVAVMSDEIYGRLIYGNAEHFSFLTLPELRSRLILLDGWSKTYAMTGWRLGFGVWPSGLAELATRLAINTHSCVNAAAQYAGIAALTGPQDAVAAMQAAFAARRNVVVDELNRIPGIRCASPGGAFYAFPNVTGTGFDCRTLQDRLLEEAGVAIIAGTSFGDSGEGYIRLSYANSVENIRLAISRIANWLQQNGKAVSEQLA
jgi:aspartate/methionine/tyrosine aminotransferase